MPITILLEPEVLLFYSKLSKMIGVPLETVLSDALFKLAGELSLEALQNRSEERIFPTTYRALFSSAAATGSTIKVLKIIRNARIPESNLNFFIFNSFPIKYGTKFR